MLMPSLQLLNSGGEGGGEAELRTQYLTLLKDKLDKWCKNVVAMEVAPWYVIPDPDTDEEPFQPEMTRDGRSKIQTNPP